MIYEIYGYLYFSVCDTHGVHQDIFFYEIYFICNVNSIKINFQNIPESIKYLQEYLCS